MDPLPSSSTESQKKERRIGARLDVISCRFEFVFYLLREGGGSASVGSAFEAVASSPRGNPDADLVVGGGFASRVRRGSR